MNHGRWALVGRDSEVGRICSLIADSPTSAVLVHGASGVGKTRVAQEAASRLEAMGWAILTITGTAGLAAVPLAALAPIFAGEQPNLEAITASPFALLDYAKSRIDAIAADRRAVIVVDDISLVDTLSLSVIVQLLQAGRVKLIATAREGVPLPDSIVAMWTGDAAARVDLAPLTIDDCAEIITAELGGQVAHRTVAALFEASGGNPLYLRELMLGAIESGTLVDRERAWQLVGAPSATPALRDVILTRLSGISPAGRDVAERLALCQPLPVDELVGEGARAALGALEQAGLVTIDETGDRLTASLAHPQYVSAVRSSLSRLRSADILLEQADLVTGRAGGELNQDDAVRVAIWRLGAGSPTNPELLATGARLTRLAGDFPETVRLAQAAIRAGADDAGIHLLLGEALRTLGRTAQALASLERSAAAAVGGPNDIASEIATMHALTKADEPLGFSNGLKELEEAQSKFPEHAVAIALTRSTLLLYAENANLALAELETVPSGPGVPDVLVIARAVASILPLGAAGRSAEALVAAQLALDHAQNAPAGTAIISKRTALFLMASTLVSAGSPDRARQCALDALREAISADDEVSTRHAEFTLGHCYMEMGQLRTSARWFRDAVSGAIAHGPVSFRGPASGALAVLLAWRGEAEKARAALATIAPDQAAWDVSSIIASASLEALDGNLPAARDRFVRASDRYRDGGYAYLESWLLFLASRVGYPADVTARLAELAANCDSPLIAMRAAHVAALVSGSSKATADAGEQWKQHGHLLFAAEAYAAAAGFATAEGSARDSAAYARESATLADLCEGAETPGLKAASAAELLTTREREIAVMASRGLSSQAIASQLFLSIRTVDNHLQAAYRKLGVGGRADLATAL